MVPLTVSLKGGTPTEELLKDIKAEVWQMSFLMVTTCKMSWTLGPLLIGRVDTPIFYHGIIVYELSLHT